MNRQRIIKADNETWLCKWIEFEAWFNNAIRDYGEPFANTLKCEYILTEWHVKALELILAQQEMFVCLKLTIQHHRLTAEKQKSRFVSFRLEKPVYSLAKCYPVVPLRLPDDLKTFQTINHNLMTRRWNVNYQNTNRQSWSVFVTTFDVRERKKTNCEAINYRFCS